MKTMEFIDLRSDTVTLPTDEMLEAIKAAELGDDVFREDSTVNKLEIMAAKKMGKEAALLVASGTQANLVSLLGNTKRGNLVILEAESHIYWYEVGGLSAIAGLLPWPVRGDLGILDPKDIEAAMRPKNIHFPEMALICIENTHNRYGGTITTPDQIKAVSKVAKAFGLKLYMDGARIFNAAVALKVDVKDFTRHVDNLMFCLSKGLSCPIGSIVVGTDEFIEKARKNRKILGGGMRQAGIIAAPGIVALEKMIDRLEEDHKNARALAEGLAQINGISIELENVQTNIVHFDVSELPVTSEQFASKLRENGVLALPRDKKR
ncbi:MAG: aminotransferase class I/II-fold pyridoxal phosphate-dependent enzyme, partial [Candidatus Bathyarchaeota archaeon]|nr:aminotransferase class I/II-fold pyridoxal phosphate-dependent enzyme [Candidatus Bathyarchaeota archaeon]